MRKERPWDPVVDYENKYGPDSLYTCHVCGFFMTWHERNLKQHRLIHNRHLDVQEDWGYSPLYIERERLKDAGRRIMRQSMNAEVKKFGFMLLMYSHFCRSIESCYDMDKHPSLEDYFAMLLNQEELYGNEYQDIADELRKTVGTKEGMSGTYFDTED